MNKESVVKFSKGFIVFLFQVALSRLELFSAYSFGFSFALTRLFFGENLMAVAIEYAVSNLFFYNQFYQIISVAFEIIILSLYVYFCEVLKINKKIIFAYVFLILSVFFKLYLTIIAVFSWNYFLIELAIKLVSLIYFLKLFEAYRKKFIFFRCGNIDYLLFSIFTILILLGIFRYPFLKENFSLFFIVLSFVVCCRILPLDKFLIFAIAIALSFCSILCSTKLILFAMIALLFLIAFSKLNKYLYLILSLALVLSLINLGRIFCVKSIVEALSALLMFCLVPQKIYSLILSFFSDRKMNYIRENSFQQKERDLKQKLYFMSKTLVQMKNDFRFLIVGKIDRKNASLELAKDIIQNCCLKCEHQKFCAKTIIDKQNYFAEYIFYAMQQGSICIDDISVGFQTYCHKINLVLDEIDRLTKRFLKFEITMKNEDESKLLISTQFENSAKLFENFAKNMENSSKINENLSIMAKETLLNNMIDVNDVCIFENKKGIEKIDVIADNNLIVRKELSIGLAKVIQSKIQVKSIKHLEFSGLSLASFIVASKLKLEFAVSTKAKEKANGDSTVILKIDDSRYFVAIADGMGHGDLANKTSKMVLELVKNLFVVGIDLELVIDSINKLLIPIGMDNFSTLDIAVVDLSLCKCTFIKLGSSVSVIKHKQTAEMVICKSLPVGIVQNIKPTIVTVPIVSGDIIFLASDGIVDSFGEVENYKTYLNDSKIVGLQKFTDNLLYEVDFYSKGHIDDMSIIALKLLKN